MSWWGRDRWSLPYHGAVVRAGYTGLSFSVGDADGLLDRLGLVEDAQHQVGDVGPGCRPTAPDVASVRGPVRAGQRLVGQAGRADRGPGPATVAQQGLPEREVGVRAPGPRADPP